MALLSQNHSPSVTQHHNLNRQIPTRFSMHLISQLPLHAYLMYTSSYAIIHHMDY